MLAWPLSLYDTRREEVKGTLKYLKLLKNINLYTNHVITKIYFHQPEGSQFIGSLYLLQLLDIVLFNQVSFSSSNITVRNSLIKVDSASPRTLGRTLAHIQSILNDQTNNEKGDTSDDDDADEGSLFEQSYASRLVVCSLLFCSPLYIHSMQSRKQCALPVITILVLWQLVHLCT